MKALPFSPADLAYLDEVTDVLQRRGAKTSMAQAFAPIIERHRTVPINGIIRDVMTDVACHLGTYSSLSHAPVPLDETMSFADGLDRLLAALGELRGINQLHDLPPEEGDAVAWEPPARLYLLTWRKLAHNGQIIDVTELAQVPFHFVLLKAVEADVYYLAILKNHSAAYYEVIVRLDEAQAARARAALAVRDMAALGRLADAC
ncbi:MAG: hypothetical protein IPL79_02100 [Myxococcales bacterium]|nr:hypothetical protein [Myxococcales bacterium]